MLSRSATAFERFPGRDLHQRRAGELLLVVEQDIRHLVWHFQSFEEGGLGPAIIRNVTRQFKLRLLAFADNVHLDELSEQDRSLVRG